MSSFSKVEMPLSGSRVAATGFARAAVTEEVMPHIGGLRGQAELVLMRRLKIDPDNAKALLQVGEICRAKGDLAAALRAYRRASAISGPGRQKAAWLQALLGGDRLPHRPRGIWRRRSCGS